MNIWIETPDDTLVNLSRFDVIRVNGYRDNYWIEAAILRSDGDDEKEIKERLSSRFSSDEVAVSKMSLLMVAMREAALLGMGMVNIDWEAGDEE